MFLKYVDLLKRDVCRHSFDEADAWPQDVAECARSMLDALSSKLPAWVRTGPYPHVDPRARPLLDELGRCDVRELRKDGTVDDLPLFNALGMCLGDCARLRYVVDSERIYGSQSPKEAFLTIFVINIMRSINEGLVSHEEMSVALPRHLGGESSALLNYTSRGVRAPLVVSTVRTCSPRPSSPRSCSPRSCSPTMVESAEEEERGMDLPLPAEFDAHFFACAPGRSMSPPSAYCVPILTLADDDDLPVLMSSMLYQRRVWRVSSPLVGLGFSKYDTSIRLYLGWVQENTGSERVLPTVHIGQVDTENPLDLCDPLIALSFCRCLLALRPLIRSVTRDVAATVIADMQRSSLSWRLDTFVDDDTRSADEPLREMVMRWTEEQGCMTAGHSMPLQEISEIGSEAASPSSTRQTPEAIGPEISSPSGDNPREDVESDPSIVEPENEIE